MLVELWRMLIDIISFPRHVHLHVMLIIACDADMISGVFRGLGKCALSLPAFAVRNLSKCKMDFQCLDKDLQQQTPQGSEGLSSAS